MTLTLPTAATATNYKMLAGSAFYRTRKKPVLGIVLHITAGLQDLGFVGTDESAEGTIRWALNSGARVSWHAGADTDGVELCIPDWFTAWHATGVNSATVGIEISKLNVDWSTASVSDRWVEATLRNAARYLAAIVKKHGLPLTLQTSKAAVDDAIAANRKFGFVYHSTTSAGTRSDPGKNFPIDRLFDMIRAELAGSTTTTPTSPQEDEMATIDEIKHALKGALAEAALRATPADRQAHDALRTAVRMEVAGLESAVAVLAESKGVDPAAIVAEVGAAVRERLALIAVSDGGQQ